MSITQATWLISRWPVNEVHIHAYPIICQYVTMQINDSMFMRHLINPIRGVNVFFLDYRLRCQMT
jgi:hypothetical protein